MRQIGCRNQTSVRVKRGKILTLLTLGNCKKLGIITAEEKLYLAFPSSRLNTTTYYMYFVNIILANQMPHLLVSCFKKRLSIPILQPHEKWYFW